MWGTDTVSTLSSVPYNEYTTQSASGWYRSSEGDNGLKHTHMLWCSPNHPSPTHPNIRCYSMVPPTHPNISKNPFSMQYIGTGKTTIQYVPEHMVTMQHHLPSEPHCKIKMCWIHSIRVTKNFGTPPASNSNNSGYRCAMYRVTQRRMPRTNLPFSEGSDGCLKQFREWSSNKSLFFNKTWIKSKHIREQISGSCEDWPKWIFHLIFFLLQMGWPDSLSKSLD